MCKNKIKGVLPMKLKEIFLIVSMDSILEDLLKILDLGRGEGGEILIKTSFTIN